MERTVKVKNLTNKTIGLKLPQYNLNRKWVKRGQTISIPFSVLEQVLWEEGVRKIFERGILYIEELQDKIDLGLEPEDAKVPENIIALNDGQLRTLLKVKPYAEFIEVIKTLKTTQIKNVVNFAIENECVDLDKCAYLKELTGSDIIQAIKINREMDAIK